MPCSMAVVHYVECQHDVELKLGCATCATAKDVCPKELWEVLLSVEFTAACRECFDSGIDAMKAEGLEVYQDQGQQILMSNALTEEMKNSEVSYLATKVSYWTSMLEARRDTQRADKQLVNVWVKEYGDTIFELLYGDILEVTDADEGQEPELEHENQPDIEMYDAMDQAPEERSDTFPRLELSDNQKDAIKVLHRLLKTKPPDLVVVLDASRDFTITLPELGHPSARSFPKGSCSLSSTMEYLANLLQRCRYKGPQACQSKTLTSKALGSVNRQ